MKQTTAVMPTTPASWISCAAKIVQNAPNRDWQKSTFSLIPGEPVDVKLIRYNPKNGYKAEQFGTAKMMFFKWDKPEGSFIGFGVAVYNTILEATPVINLNGEWTDESRQHACNGIARHIENRVCPKCGKFDTIKFGRRVISCRCGFRESAI
jgi:hypothetical protein